jgi:hypothetical protein
MSPNARSAARRKRWRGSSTRIGISVRSAVAAIWISAYTCVLWNSIPRDWADPEGWVDRALSHCRAQPWTLMVLHDLPTGAMAHLPRFLDKVGEAGGRIRQDFPPDCVPIVDGKVVRPIQNYVAAA